MEITKGTSPTLRFGVYEADLQAGELRKLGERVKLQSQPFQVLAALLDRPGRVVTRDELQQMIWPADTFVDFDRGLNKAINRLRDALDDSSAKPSFIETLPKRGYRFIARVDRRISSIAVLPLKNLSGDPNQEYWADGITEELTAHLARISSLRVISRARRKSGVIAVMAADDLNFVQPQWGGSRLRRYRLMAIDHGKCIDSPVDFSLRGGGRRRSLCFH